LQIDSIAASAFALCETGIRLNDLRSRGERRAASLDHPE